MERKNELGKKEHTQQELRAAIHRALRHLETRYDDAPTTEELAEIAGLSTFHFHRAFRSVVGETVAKYSQRLRVERGASLLRSSNWHISEIGLACGFDTPASFARAFKRLYGKTPGEFRKDHGTVPFLRGYLRSHPDQPLPSQNFVAPTAMIEDWPEIQVITLRYIGSVEGVLTPWNELLHWAKSNLKNLNEARFFGLWFDDWHTLDEHRYRYECAILPNEPIGDLPKPFAWRTIPAGKVAVTPTRGTLKELNQSWKAFGEGWLPFSGFQPREDYALDEYPASLTLAPFPKKLLLGALGSISIRLCLPVQTEFLEL